MIWIFLLLPTVVFAQEYTKINDQVFQKQIVVTVDYEQLKGACNNLRIEEQYLLQRASELNQRALSCEAEISTLEAQGAKEQVAIPVQEIEEPVEIIE